jgi:hypothetical protein
VRKIHGLTSCALCDHDARGRGISPAARDKIQEQPAYRSDGRSGQYIRVCGKAALHIAGSFQPMR